MRHSKNGDLVACLFNFSPNPKNEHQVGLPRAGTWTEILNTDSPAYDGTGQFGNFGRVIATTTHGGSDQAQAKVCLPPLGAVWLKWDPAATAADPGDAGVGA